MAWLPAAVAPSVAEGEAAAAGVIWVFMVLSPVLVSS